MVRLLPALVLVLGLAVTATASAKELEATVKFKVKKLEGQKGKDKVVFKLSLPDEVYKALRGAKGRVKVNFYRGKTAEDSKQFKSVKWALRKATHKWPTFSVKELCRKGYQHVRVKIKAKAKGVEYDAIQKSLDLGCG
jgi:hypothetical protein